MSDTTKPCVICHADNEPMGKMGGVVYFRCRQCGMQYMSTIKEYPVVVEQKAKPKPSPRKG